MPKPLVAIVGRPNVGKSTFFNKIIGQRLSIVEDTPGVTRDRIYADAEWAGRRFTLIDTGGLDMRSDDVLLEQMRYQAQMAIDTADVICFFTDVRSGMNPDDQEVANFLRKSKKPVLLIVNKVDYKGLENDVYEFYNLGLGDPIPVSSTNMLGLGDVLQYIVDILPPKNEDEYAQHENCNIAFIGRPNVGKSSLVNNTLKQERTMVSNIPGTTRDAVDTEFKAENGNTYVLIDTAGIRRKSSVETATLEKYSVLRAINAIDRCDVAILVIDATTGVTDQDEKIAGLVLDAGKGIVVVINKWDIVDKTTGTLEKFKRQVLENLNFMQYAPVLFTSALTGKRVDTILDTVDKVWDSCRKRITTGVLNDVITDAQVAIQPPSKNGKRLRIYYATQKNICPPTFIIFINDESLMHFAYHRYLENQLRKAFGFEGTPLKLIAREKKQNDQ